MTTALIWWIAVLGITGGLVVAVRAWRWSPGQGDPSGLQIRDRGARPALLPVVSSSRSSRSWWLLAGLLPAVAGAAKVLGA